MSQEELLHSEAIETTAKTTFNIDECEQSAWPAPLASRPVHATITIPGSKSLSNRYLILAALGSHAVTLQGLLRSRDTTLMMQALEALGVAFEEDAGDNTTVRVIPPVNGQFHGDVAVYCGLAGTVMRFVPALAMFAKGAVHFDGDEQAYHRPMKPILDALVQLGATVTYDNEEGFLPFTITPPQTDSEMRSGIATMQLCDGISVTDIPEMRTVTLDASGSSQFISGLLLAASRLPYGLEIRHTGKTLPSQPHISMTMHDVESAGGIVSQEGSMWRVLPSTLQLAQHIDIEPDLSNAAPFAGAALITHGEVRIPRWPVHTTQPGGLLPEMLRTMGAEVTLEIKNNCNQNQSGTLVVRHSGPIHGLGDYDIRAAGEIAPSLAALAVLADAPTRFHGIAHLRGHETNRLEALVREIRRIGGEARELEDGIEILPLEHWADYTGTTMKTYADHRMATFAAMLGLAVPNIRIININTTRKTIPDFVGMWQTLLQDNSCVA